MGWESEQEGLCVAGHKRQGVKIVTDVNEIDQEEHKG